MTSKQGIIYLQKDKFQLYSPFLRQIVEFRFVPEIIRDSDVINPEMLESLIKVFVANTKIPPGNLTIILADNSYFVKDFVLPPQPKPVKGQPQQPTAQMTMETIHVLSMNFVEHIPYENVVSKSIPIKDGIRVCAVNKDFFDSIANSFIKLGFTVDTVYPGFVLGNNLSARPVLDNAFVNAYFSKVSTLKAFDLMQEDVYKPQPREGLETSAEMEIDYTDDKNKKPDKKRLYGMVGLLTVLLIILVVVYMQSLTPPPVAQTPATQGSTVQPVQPAAESVNTAPVVTTVPESEDTGSTTTTDIKASDIAVQITAAAGSETTAQTLRDAFSKFSFKTLTVSSQSKATTTSTVVSFSASVNQTVRNAVLVEIRKVKTNVTVQERQEGDYDITIIIAN
jgi:hypothetical protein